MTEPMSVIGATMTSSPGRRRSAETAMWREAVPEEHGWQYFSG